MENSSKALIVAGSVILAVLIITLGMYFYNQSTTTGKGLNMTDYEIKQFNSKFKMYEGKMNASQASELLDAIERHNVSVGKDGIGVVVYYTQSNSYPGSPAPLPEDYFDTLWYKSPNEIYAKCFKTVESGKILNGTEADNINTHSNTADFIENRTYYCTLFYSKSNGLIMGIIIHV